MDSSLAAIGAGKNRRSPHCDLTQFVIRTVLALFNCHSLVLGLGLCPSRPGNARCPPTTPGVLERVYVTPGDYVGTGKTVALIGDKPLTTLTGGIITSVQNTPGQIVSSVTPVVEMIDPNQLRVIGRIDEDKGLADIRVGQGVTFTVDAFSSKKYSGVVEEISPSSRQQDIVFSISDKRQVSQFDITVKFDVDKYPELKNGMSAKMKVYK